MDEGSTAVIIITTRQNTNKLVTWWKNGDYLLTTLPGALCSDNVCGKLLAWSERTSKPSRIYIHSQEGIGQFSALTTIVVSARNSEYNVLYRPDGDDMTASVVRPSILCKGFYDLSNQSQEICANNFLQWCHENDLEGHLNDPNYEESIETIHVQKSTIKQVIRIVKGN